MAMCTAVEYGCTPFVRSFRRGGWRVPMRRGPGRALFTTPPLATSFSGTTGAPQRGDEREAAGPLCPAGRRDGVRPSTSFYLFRLSSFRHRDHTASAANREDTNGTREYDITSQSEKHRRTKANQCPSSLRKEGSGKGWNSSRRRRRGQPLSPSSFLSLFALSL